MDSERMMSKMDAYIIELKTYVVMLSVTAKLENQANILIFRLLIHIWGLIWHIRLQIDAFFFKRRNFWRKFTDY